jgi:hypothetical protein
MGGFFHAMRRRMGPDGRMPKNEMIFIENKAFIGAPA